MASLGRSPVVSWFAINAAVLGQLGKPWPEALTALLPTNWFKAETVAQVRRLWWFGRLIGNTDMHDGNLSFVPGTTLPGRPTAPLALAPVYDMLPMAYAPVRGVELPPGTFQLQLPLPADGPAWIDAAEAGCAFWDLAAQDPRISPDFRRLCGQNLEQLRTLQSSMRM